MSAGDVRLERLTQVSLTGGLLVASMLLGLGGQALIAYFFGTGTRSDSLFLARDIGDLAAKTLLTAQAVGVLVPFVVTLRANDGPKASDRALSAILTAVALAGTLLAVLIAALADPLVTLLAPGFDSASAERSVGLLRIIAPMTPFVAVTALGVGALQARHRFGRAMTANLVGGAALLATMPPLVHFWGVEGAAGAMTAGAVASGISVWAFLLAEGVPPALSPWRERAHLTEFVRRTTPFLSYAAATQGSGAMLRIAASLLGAGLYAAFSLASRLFRAVVSILVLPVQHVLLPALSHSEAGGRTDASAAEIVATLRYAAVALVPVSVALCLLSSRVVSIVFERGEFSAESASETGHILALFALAVLPTAMYTLLEQAAYARRLTPLIVRVNLGVEFIQGALYIPAVLLLGAGGIPIAGLLATVVAAVVYLRRLKPSPARVHAGFVARLLACAAAMAAAVLATAALAEALLDPGPGLAQLIVVAPACLAGTAVYLAAARVTGLEEPARLGGLLRRVRA